jgi:hypothetical protein
MNKYTTEHPSQAIPYGYCQCGCGQRAPIALKTRHDRGAIKGQPNKFCLGHSIRHNSNNAVSFWNNVAISHFDDCWLWKAATNRKGYGLISLNGKLRRAHRIAYELTYGPAPKGLLVLHHCDNPSCCNPTHLFVGTAANNTEDMIAKGRAWWQ